MLRNQTIKNGDLIHEMSNESLEKKAQTQALSTKLSEKEVFLKASNIIARRQPMTKSELQVEYNRLSD